LRKEPGFRVFELAAIDRGDEQARRIERLHEVMRGRGQEARLRLVGTLGRGLGLQQRLIGGGQLGGALGDARFQGLVGALQFALRELVGGDVGVARDETTAGHGIAANLDHRAVGQLTLVRVGVALAHVLDAPRDCLVRHAVA
jgi:hypothetical protein